LKMNFNFNFKDMPQAPRQSICYLTMGCDRDYTAELEAQAAYWCRERIG
jgi:hypothetical protein